MKYLLNPTPPLISDPALCTHLSAAALKRNLSAHAICNPAILAGGTKAEMKARLKEILETRAMDLRVRGMMWNVEDAEEV